MNLIILGPQGSGKGTQAKILAKKYNLNHISTGELLRQEASTNTPQGREIKQIMEKGLLMTYETVVRVLEPQLKGSPNGFILDGTPRDIDQARHLDSYLTSNNLHLDKVIFLDVPLSESLKRLQKRAQIEKRDDDNPSAIAKRLEIYQQNTMPIIEMYRSRNLLLRIDGTPDIDTIAKDIDHKLKNEL